MSYTLTTIEQVQALVYSPDGEQLKSEREAVDLIADAMGEGVEWIVIPVERFPDDFFHLKTRLAGHIIQKFVNYRQHLVILGDISAYVAQSNALRDFVYETNRGSQVWFLADLQELSQRLKRMQ